MQRVATGFEAHRRFRSRAALSLAAGALGASLVLGPGGYAQDATPPASTPEASPVASPAAAAAEASVTSLFSYDLAAFPTSPVSVRLLRITIEPGASSPMHTHPGPEFDLVESGTLTISSTGEADIVRGGGDPVTGEITDETLGAGDLAIFPAGVGMNLVNASDEPVVILSAVFHPVNEDVQSTQYIDGDPAADAFEGVSFVVLGDGIVQSFPESAATISLESIEAPAGAEVPASLGSSLYSLVEGELAFSVQGGEVQVSRTDSPGLRPNAAPEQEFTLATGDAAFFPNGLIAAPRIDQQSALSLLRLTAEPATALTTAPAEVAVITGEETAVAEEQPATEFTEVGVGAPVVTNTDSVNLRTEPSISAEAVDQFAAGVELTVIGGPEDADDFTWWQVEVPGSEGPVQGWLAADFIDLVGGAEPTAEPETDAEPEVVAGTPEASPAATVAQEFAAGDIVAATEDNLRVRSDASVNAEPIDVYAAGTQFEITGESVEADDFTWYPVTLVDDETVSGWVAVDFVEPAAAE